MATETAMHARFPQSFHMDENGNRLVIETMHLGGYRTKTDLFKAAVQELNTKLKKEATV